MPIALGELDLDEVLRYMGTPPSQAGPELRALAELRLQNPYDSLRELGQKLTPPLSRSGVNHRLEKIIDLAARKD